MSEISALVRTFAKMRGKKCVDVARALLSTRTLRGLETDQKGHLSEVQADAAISILKGWIRRCQ
jgi:hypothetical protein